MGKSSPRPTELHTHMAATIHVLLQRNGVPYEVERRVCTACSRVLEERPLRRAAA